MSISRDPEIERLVAEELTDLGMPSVGQNCTITAFWDTEGAEQENGETARNLGIQITWNKLALRYAIQAMEITTRHPWEAANVKGKPIREIAHETAIEGLAMARHEWQRAHHLWAATGYPVVETVLTKQDGSVMEPTRVPFLGEFGTAH